MLNTYYVIYLIILQKKNILYTANMCCDYNFFSIDSVGLMFILML